MDPSISIRQLYSRTMSTMVLEGITVFQYGDHALEDEMGGTKSTVWSLLMMRHVDGCIQVHQLRREVHEGVVWLHIQFRVIRRGLTAVN